MNKFQIALMYVGLFAAGLLAFNTFAKPLDTVVQSTEITENYIHRLDPILDGRGSGVDLQYPISHFSTPMMRGFHPTQDADPSCGTPEEVLNGNNVEGTDLIMDVSKPEEVQAFKEAVSRAFPGNDPSTLNWDRVLIYKVDKRPGELEVYLFGPYDGKECVYNSFSEDELELIKIMADAKLGLNK